MKRKLLQWIAKKGWFKPIYVYCDYAENRKEMVRFRVRFDSVAATKAYQWGRKHKQGSVWFSDKTIPEFDRYVKISHYTHKIFFR